MRWGVLANLSFERDFLFMIEMKRKEEVREEEKEGLGFEKLR
jgi:hypothetical protein